MTRDDIIRMTTEAKMFPASYFNETGDGIEGLERFAALVVAVGRRSAFEEAAKLAEAWETGKELSRASIGIRNMR